MNKLFFGDNLEIMKDLLKKNPEGFIDLIYIDPPFNSKRDYNVLFESIDMEDTKAQKEAFKDTWSNVTYIDTVEEIHDLDLDLYNFLAALDNINIAKNVISYLSTMAIRIWYMHKLLKNTGSFYLHCDPTMSHYLKIVCDLVFGKKNFRNEIVWCYYGASSPGQKQFPRKHDIIFWYSKSNKWIFNPDEVRVPYNEATLKRASTTPTSIFHGKRVKRTLFEGGKLVEDYWNFPPLVSTAKERLGYPTQKPEILLERIIKASSNEGDLIADFFCGCGTAIAVAQKLKRNWLGVDISHLAVKLITERLMYKYGPTIRKTFEISGLPKDIASAKELAMGTKGGRLKFEEWIVEFMLHGVLNTRKNQPGFDGYLTFEILKKKETVLIEVKSGTATLPQVNHFIKIVDEMKAGIGLFVCFKQEVTSGMLQSAKREGYYKKEIFGNKFDKIQIITVDDLLDYKDPNLPYVEYTTFKKAEREKEESGQIEIKLKD